MLISGALPEGDADFDELQRMGVKTIISVDGAIPDIGRAEVRGMRYVHFPNGYNGIDGTRQLEIARAIRDLSGPIYLHCHHGKHRGPAAAASAAIILGEMTPEEGTAFLQSAGTAASYTGLYQCVARAEPVDEATLSKADNSFPSIAPVPGFVQAMVDMQHAFDHLTAIKEAGWKVPADHPDLVPLEEAGRMTNLLRTAHGDVYLADESDSFAKDLLKSIEVSQAFDAHLLANPTDTEGLSARFKMVSASCKDCHVAHRDTRPVGRAMSMTTSKP